MILNVIDYIPVGHKNAVTRKYLITMTGFSDSQSPWWIHESQIDKGLAEKYHWFYIDTKDGRFYQCIGQPARPFMYPALKNNEEKITRLIANDIKEQLK